MSDQKGTVQEPADSTHTVGSMATYKTIDAAAQDLADRRAGELAQWDFHWHTPVLIVALFLVGVGSGIGHHFFYAHLDGKVAKDQLTMIRYGTAMAYLMKSCLVGSVLLCYRQRIWHTFRTRALTIRAIDGLFTATEDLNQFRKWEMIKNAKLATFMAVCTWAIPIASVLSPASLTSEVRPKYVNAQCNAVASLNFTHEGTYDFRNVTSYAGASLVYYNTTLRPDNTNGWFDYYDQNSKNSRRLTVTATYLGKPAYNPSASDDACGKGWNCTYSIEFEGPGYKCEDVEDATGAPFDLKSFAPEGDYTYRGLVDLGDYDKQQVKSFKGMPADPPPYKDLLGVFTTEPVLWIGYSLNTSTPYDVKSPFRQKWGNVHTPKIFKCTAHHTKYRFTMVYNDTIQHSILQSREFLTPVIDTTLTTPDGNNDLTNVTNLVPGPAENFIRPNGDVNKYKQTAAYHAMGGLLRNFLRGEISYDSVNRIPITSSDISETKLINMATSYPVENLKEGIQNLFEDMLITLLSEPHLVVASTQSVPCTKNRSVPVFVYHIRSLWIGYAIVIFATLVFMFVGAWSIYQNGVSSDNKFSRMLVTTRNPTIDKLSVGACLGGDPFPRDLRTTKLRFGVLLEDDPRDGPLGKVEHCCFGTEGELKDIVKYGTYAGLKKYRKDAKEEAGDRHEKEGLLGEAVEK
ncbi:hypothetical protein P154DRAFT_450986 [Amniculicola lignicola CBS 123094]|uniref:Formylmethionine deformylase-like protein n=1 Tax=Amniculicola lignicola CBS 123094 TaxID=1392246 RepID=A0A6A5W675_9PLEO|nr:hypothetical protein P154DRAFT_450986 [Amniculicola lignicola CBS 123094]